MTNAFYVVRRFVATGSGFAVEDVAETDEETALHAASGWADAGTAVVVFHPDGRVLKKLGDVPDQT